MRVEIKMSKERDEDIKEMRLRFFGNSIGVTENFLKG